MDGDLVNILIIDSYDSFTNNLAALVKKAVPSSSIYIIKNDELSLDHLIHFLPFFAAVLVGPGPGSPLIASDVGVVRHLWHLPEDKILPIFGVCLGLQSLGVEFGATLKRLDVVKHGQVSRITHSSDDLFDEVPQGAAVVRYHSLYVSIEEAQKIEPLAWTEDVGENGNVLMALKHTAKPFWAVQYHPESVCTDGSGLRVIQNFWRLACAWRDRSAIKPRDWDGATQKRFSENLWPVLRSPVPLQLNFSPQKVRSSTLSIPQLEVRQICEILGVYKTSTDFVVLESAAQPGTHSIIGCIHPSSLKIQYFVGDDFVTFTQGKKRTFCALGSSDVWSWLASFMRTKQASEGNSDVPFWGGLIGYLSYELGVDTLGCNVEKRDRRFPDVNLVFIERSIVIDAKSKQVHIQSLIPKDDDWFAYTASTLKRAACGVHKFPISSSTRQQSPLSQSPLSSQKPILTCPDKSGYIAKIKLAKEYLFAGESYELCLTAQTRIAVPKLPTTSSQSSWELYKKLQTVNPAPYAAYLRLYPTTLVSSSPERFLRYSRPPRQLLQLRPIKGTVKKGGTFTRQMAEDILNSPKEIGENLMIVDLIRHDLHGVIGSNVEVKKFCGIEEYETVWQLVSVIEGWSPPPSNGSKMESMAAEVTHDAQTGWQMLKNSLPPGSMTGAPKKRSVQILQSIEQGERGIYSGVVGYWCVGGSGDWSVVIRSFFKAEDDSSSEGSTECGADQFEEWFIGAGGAITALSEPEAEWEEMVVKLQSVLRASNATSSEDN